MIGRTVLVIPRAERRGGAYPFEITHDPNVHAPYGLHRVYVNGREIGRQLSCPCLDDCERMLNPPAPRPMPERPPAGYTAATKARQGKTSPEELQRFARLRHAGEPDETAFVLHLP